MAANLVSLVMQFITPDMIAKIASALGIDRTLAQKAIGGAIPSILASFADVSSSPGGARQLTNLLAQQQSGAFDSITNMIGGAGQKAFTEQGSSMLSGLLGGNTVDALAQSVGRFAGIGDGASKSLLGMLAPMVIGALSQQQRSTGLDPSGLASLLTSQKDQITAAIPSGLADQLSASGLIDNVSSVAGRFGRGAAERTVAEASQTSRAMRSSSSPTTWPFWVLGLAALAAVGWYLLRPGSEQFAGMTTSPATQSTAPSTTVGVAPSNLTVGGVDLGDRINRSMGSLGTALGGITDASSAQAAMPAIKQAMSQLDEVRTLSGQLPADGKNAMSKLIASSMPAINQLCEKVLAIPGVGSIAKPTIDELRGKLDTLARA